MDQPMEERAPKASDPVDYTGRSRLWLPALVVIFVFLIGAAATMLIGTLLSDAESSEAPAAARETVEAGN